MAMAGNLAGARAAGLGQALDRAQRAAQERVAVARNPNLGAQRGYGDIAAGGIGAARVAGVGVGATPNPMAGGGLAAPRRPAGGLGGAARPADRGFPGLPGTGSPGTTTPDYLNDLPSETRAQLQFQGAAAHGNTFNPYGSTVHAANGDGSYTTIQNLSRDQQLLLDQGEGLRINANMAAGTAGRNAAQALQSPLDLTGLTAVRRDLNTSGFTAIPTSVSPTGDTAMRGSVATPAWAAADAIQHTIGADADLGMWGYGQAPTARSLDFSSLGAVPDVSETARAGVENALYARATARLDPEWQRAERALTGDLAARGIVAGSAAHRQELDDFARRRTDAYAAARNDAIAGGGGEQSRLATLGLAARAQRAGELTTAGNFGLSADAQSFGQTAAQRDQLFNQALQRGTFGQSAQAMAFGQGLSNAQLANAANAQQYSQGLSNAQLQQRARDQQLQEYMVDAEMRQQARAREIGEQQLQRDSAKNDLGFWTQQGAGPVGLAAPAPGWNASAPFAQAASQSMAQQQAEAQKTAGVYGAAANLGGSLLGGLAQGKLGTSLSNWLFG